MSMLEYYGRTWVAFDAENEDHRKWFNDFQEKRSWGQCPVRFIMPDDRAGDLVTLIQRKLIDYYVGKEFKDKKNAKKVATRIAKSKTKTWSPA